MAKIFKAKSEQGFINTFRSVKYMVGLVWCERTGRAYIFLKSIMAVSVAGFSLVYTIVPGLIINELINGELSDKLVLYLCIQILTPLVHHALNSANNHFTVKLELSFNRILSTKQLYFLSCMDYEMLENPKVQILQDRALDTIYDALSIVGRLTELISSVISLLAISSIIISLNPLIILMVVSVIYINSLATKWLNKKNYIADKKKDDLGPSRHAYSSPLYSLYWGKDIRLLSFSCSACRQSRRIR